MRQVDIFTKVANKPPMYSMVLLDEESKQKLISWWESSIGPLLPKIYCHHMTIKLGPRMDEYMALPIGESVDLQVIGYNADERGQAVVVNSPIEVKSGLPHVTVATDGVTPPKYSNQLLKIVNDIDGPVLSGIVTGFYAGG